MSDEILRPRLIVVAGPNGAGKTSITEQLLRHEWMGGCEYVNPDYIARDEFGDWNAPDAIRKAAVRAEEVRERCVREWRSLAFETVLSMPDKIDFIQRAKQAGFFVRLFFVGTDNPASMPSTTGRLRAPCGTRSMRTVQSITRKKIT